MRPLRRGVGEGDAVEHHGGASDGHHLARGPPWLPKFWATTPVGPGTLLARATEQRHADRDGRDDYHAWQRRRCPRQDRERGAGARRDREYGTATGSSAAALYLAGADGRPAAGSRLPLLYGRALAAGATRVDFCSNGQNGGAACPRSGAVGGDDRLALSRAPGQAGGGGEPCRPEAERLRRHAPRRLDARRYAWHASRGCFGRQPLWRRGSTATSGEPLRGRRAAVVGQPLRQRGCGSEEQQPRRGSLCSRGAAAGPGTLRPKGG
mmetsp:Transcript_35594/g.111751  ORF Transcript_35594/g.111751 Transcript_35594/m.111751 type:complete len:266 (-) Transcript_35594:308-1105(-)